MVSIQMFTIYSLRVWLFAIVRRIWFSEMIGGPFIPAIETILWFEYDDRCNSCTTELEMRERAAPESIRAKLLPSVPQLLVKVTVRAEPVAEFVCCGGALGGTGVEVEGFLGICRPRPRPRPLPALFECRPVLRPPWFRQFEVRFGWGVRLSLFGNGLEIDEELEQLLLEVEWAKWTDFEEEVVMVCAGSQYCPLRILYDRFLHSKCLSALILRRILSVTSWKLALGMVA